MERGRVTDQPRADRDAQQPRSAPLHPSTLTHPQKPPYPRLRPRQIGHRPRAQGRAEGEVIAADAQQPSGRRRPGADLAIHPQQRPGTHGMGGIAGIPVGDDGLQAVGHRQADVGIDQDHPFTPDQVQGVLGLGLEVGEEIPGRRAGPP